MDLIALLQALLAPDFKHLRMPAYKAMLVSAALFALLGQAHCQKLPSKLNCFVLNAITTVHFPLHKNNSKCSYNNSVSGRVKHVAAVFVKTPLLKSFLI